MPASATTPQILSIRSDLVSPEMSRTIRWELIAADEVHATVRINIYVFYFAYGDAVFLVSWNMCLQTNLHILPFGYG